MFKKYTLKNGVRLIIAPRHETQAVTVMAGIAAGSRYEPENLAGISHFVEHMSFKGSKKRPSPEAVNNFINNIGGIYNAYTDKELTAYHVKISSDHLLDVFDYLADNLINPLNKQEEFDREKGVVIEDIKMHKDRPMEEVIELFEEAVYSELALGRRITGTVESVKNIKLTDLNRYEQDHYIAENLVVVVAGSLGRLSEEEVVSAAEKYFTSRPGKKIQPKKSNTLEKSILTIGERKTEQTNLIVGFGAPGIQSSDRYALKMLGSILGGSSSSRMFVTVRERLGLAYAAESDYQPYSDAGSILTLANIAHENIEKAARAIIGEYRKIIDNPPSEEEMNRAREMIKSAVRIGLEDSENLAEMLLRMEIIEGQIREPEAMLDRYLKVSSDEVAEAAKKYLRFDKMVVSIVGSELKRKKLEKILG